MGHDAATAMMAVAFFGAVAITAMSIAAVWMKRIGARRTALPVDSQTERLARIESAVEAIAIEVERISEAQRFSARLQAGEAGLLSQPARAPEGRVNTPH